MRAKGSLTIVKPPSATIRTSWGKFGSDRVVTNHVLVIKIIAFGVSGGFLNFRPSLCIDRSTQTLFIDLVDGADSALEKCVDRPMIGKPEWRCRVSYLLQDLSFMKYSITPRRYPRLFSSTCYFNLLMGRGKSLRGVIIICAVVVFICWHKVNFRLRIKGKCIPSDHL